MAYSYISLIETLTAAGIQDPAPEAALLLEHFAGVSYATLMVDRTRIYESPKLDEAVDRRCERYPLQYILGTWEFFGCHFTVNEHCLIPRPDTEILVEEAIRRLPSHAHIADLCTGSGCIAVATLANRPDITAEALELYPQTLALAVQNAAANDVSTRFHPVEADLLSGGVERLSAYAPYDAILSNPPYIPTADMIPLEPEVHHEPRAALDGGADGLCFYRAILQKYAPLIRPGGMILLEIGYDQANALSALVNDHLPTATSEVIRDLGGNDRVVIINLPLRDSNHSGDGTYTDQ